MIWHIFNQIRNNQNLSSIPQTSNISGTFVCYSLWYHGSNHFLLFWNSILVASALLYWHWEAMLVSYLATRKTVLPFHTLSEMYENTDFRLALIPSTSFEDSFKYSADPLWQKIYKERLQPHLQEYSDYPDHLSDMVNFLRNDYKTALYDGVIVLRYFYFDQDLLNQTFLNFFLPQIIKGI